ncbi:MAG: guanylate kinase [Ignavibacteria bacterium]|nr:guanylate kinase [Ignavibacteria bacterium]MCC7158986.1 guanylate kinase [Ignavibacteria bacterium]
MLFVISAPSGAGKTTIIRELFKKIPGLKFSVSATTRRKRDTETDGKDYHFITPEMFNKHIESNEFAEFEEVHGNFYGTLKSEISKYVDSGSSAGNLVLDLDVKGALSIKKLYPEAVSIFIEVPVEELIRRLKNRKTESDEEIEKRTSRIKMEVEKKHEFDYVVDNSHGLEDAVNETAKIIKEKLNK